MEKKTWKKFLIQELTITGLLLIAVAGLVAYVDPFFHYHAPIDGFSYIMDNERYQNDGITRNFEYDALITGTSVSENFRASLVDELFGVNRSETVREELLSITIISSSLSEVWICTLQ